MTDLWPDWYPDIIPGPGINRRACSRLVDTRNMRPRLILNCFQNKIWVGYRLFRAVHFVDLGFVSKLGRRECACVRLPNIKYVWSKSDWVEDFWLQSAKRHYERVNNPKNNNPAKIFLLYPLLKLTKTTTPHYMFFTLHKNVENTSSTKIISKEEMFFIIIPIQEQVNQHSGVNVRVLN